MRVALTALAGAIAFAVGWQVHKTELLQEWYRAAINAALLLWYRHPYALIKRIVDGVRAARSSRVRGANDRVILVRRGDGPVVESRYSKYPLPLSRIPVRSLKADGKRAAWVWAERQLGRELTWKQARRYVNRLDREGRALMSIGDGHPDPTAGVVVPVHVRPVARR